MKGFKDKVKLPKGRIEFFRIIGDDWVPILKKHNTLTGNAPQIQARCLGGDENYLITNIKCMQNSGLVVLAEGTVNKSYPVSGQVQFLALFDEASFNGTFDRVQLDTSGLSFSIALGFSVTKLSTERIAIIWTLTIS